MEKVLKIEVDEFIAHRYGIFYKRRYKNGYNK